MEEKNVRFSSFRTFFFIAVVCIICALILSLLAETLKEPQKNAKELYRSKQLLLAAHLLDYEGHLIVDGIPTLEKAKNHEILELFETRILTRLTNDQGKLFTFKEVGIDEVTYLADNAKLGYAHLPYKLIYIVKENS
ncbi:MAG: hypothetical protein KDK76_00980, partial [Chlamydiia bacterium]|nr:hypothetical protein [Chlamydiia bacterium]